MAEKQYHEKGIAGKLDKDGEMVRPGHTHTVVSHGDDPFSDPVPMGHFGSEEDAVAYRKAMNDAGMKGLRVVRE